MGTFINSEEIIITKGFVTGYVLTNRETDKGIAISIWNKEEDAVANEQSGYYQEQVDKVKHLFAALPVREGYEVSIQF